MKKSVLSSRKGQRPGITFIDKNFAIRSRHVEGKNGTKAISFFSGCGGLDIGSHLARVQVLSSMDVEVDCIKTLRANKLFQKTDIRHCDIRTLSGKDYNEVIKAANPEKLILIGGPPCQPFSKAGYWIGNNSRQGIDDPRNMIGEYMRLVKELKPDGFLLENVESILHPTNKVAVEYISERVNKLGYYLQIVKANAVDFGVPQKRKRVFFLASRKDFKGSEPIKTHGSSEEILQIPKLKPYERVIDWIGKFDGPDFFEPQEAVEQGTYYRELNAVPPGKNYIALTSAAGHKNPRFVSGRRFWNFLLKLHPDEPSWTIAAQPGPWVGPFHWSSRRLRVPEIASIQTFPENYRFQGSRRSIQKQIGNAVPPLLGKAMIEHLVASI